MHNFEWDKVLFLEKGYFWQNASDRIVISGTVWPFFPFVFAAEPVYGSYSVAVYSVYCDH